MLSTLARLLQKEKLGHAARQVPGALAAPFKAFAQWSLYLDAQRRKPEVKQASGQSSSAAHLHYVDISPPLGLHGEQLPLAA